MYQTLFLIPAELFGQPVFGFGLALGVWGVICLIWLGLLLLVPEKRKDLQGAVPMMLLVAIMLALVAPRLVKDMPTGERGVPIQGYGVMMLVAIVSGVGLAAYRARQVGVDPETIFSLALWMCLAGVVGARAFFVVQKWEQFQDEDTGQMLVKIMSFTEGGLVVFGAAMGALAALAAFCFIRRLPVLAVADLVAPSMMVGQAIGRIGCLLNGCCYGGYCETSLAVTFPPEAPAYQDALDDVPNGMLLGVRFAAEPAEDGDGERVYISWVRPGSNAEQAGAKEGDTVRYLMGKQIDNLEDVHKTLAHMPRIIGQDTLVSRTTRFTYSPAGIAEQISWAVPDPSPRSAPLHPTQIYSAIDAGLLALVLWFFYPFRRTDGEVIALMLTLHPISRLLLEVVRIDEPGVYGTPLTISQIVGLLMLACAILLWIRIESRPKKVALAKAIPPSSA